MSVSPWATVPNAVTLLRLLLVPVFLWFHWRNYPEWALAAFVVASFYDLLDGLLARLLNQRSKLGGVLDPIADKALIFAALFSLLFQGLIPIWLVAVTAFRDGLMVIGALMVKYKNLEIPTEPSRIGKYSTFMMTIFVCLVLLRNWPEAPAVFQAYVPAVGFIAGLCVVISTLQYFARFGYLWFVPVRRVR
jgi:cardiolipin synthase